MINFISNELNPVTVLSSEPYARPCHDPCRRRRRHASAVGDPRSPRGRVLSLLEATLPLSSPGSVSVSPSPSSSPSASRQASRAELAAGAAPAKPHCPASFPCAQCRASSPRTSSIHPRARPCPIPTESSPRPPATIDNPVELRPLSSSSTFRPPFAQIESPVSFSARPSSFPAISLRDLGAADIGTLLRRRLPPPARRPPPWRVRSGCCCAHGGRPPLLDLFQPFPAAAPPHAGEERGAAALLLRAAIRPAGALPLCRLAQAAARPSSTAGRPAHGRRARAGVPPCLAGAEQGSSLPLPLSLFR